MKVPAREIAVGLLIAVICASSRSATLFAGGFNSHLYEILAYDSKPVARVIGSMGIQASDIAWDQTSGTMYAVDFLNLYQIDPLTATSTRIGYLGGISVNALEVDQWGTMYAWGGTQLYRIDKNTGAATSIGGGGFSSAGDISVDSLGNLWGASSTDKLIKLDTLTGQQESVGPFGAGPMFGLEIDVDGTMYAGWGPSSQASRIYRVNPQTGAATFVGSIAGSEGLGLWGLTFDMNPVPETSSIAVILFGSAVILAVTRKKT